MAVGVSCLRIALYHLSEVGLLMGKSVQYQDKDRFADNGDKARCISGVGWLLSFSLFLATDLQRRYRVGQLFSMFLTDIARQTPSTHAP